MTFRFLALDQLYASQDRLRAEFRDAAPYPHVVIDDFAAAAELVRVERAFPSPNDSGWIDYVHYNERKHALSKKQMMPPPCRELIDELSSPEFLAWLAEVSGMPDLRPDPDLAGGGLHQSGRGGFLNVHADFTVHPHRQSWRRRLNLLLYLNSTWRTEYRGELELWARDMSRCVARIAPLFNRCVIFETDESSFHGVPDAICCPPDMSRKSIALYYFTEEAQAPRRINTNYRARPGESGWRKALIWLDKAAVGAYSRIKSRLRIDDGAAGKLLGLLRAGRRRH